MKEMANSDGSLYPYMSQKMGECRITYHMGLSKMAVI